MGGGQLDMGGGQLKQMRGSKNRWGVGTTDGRQLKQVRGS